MTAASSSGSWVALVRGINVGRHRRVAMHDLRELLESLGYEDVRTHLQSGNAIFSGGRGGAAGHERKIAAAIAADLGLDVKVFVRSAQELDRIVSANPFATKRADPKGLHVVFLDATPQRPAVAKLDPERYAPDEFAFGDRTIYVRMPNGFQGSRLPDWEKLLGLSATMRTWNVVTRLRDMAS